MTFTTFPGKDMQHSLYSWHTIILLLSIYTVYLQALANKTGIFSSEPQLNVMIECIDRLLFLVPSSEWSSLHEVRLDDIHF